MTSQIRRSKAAFGGAGATGLPFKQAGNAPQQPFVFRSRLQCSEFGSSRSSAWAALSLGRPGLHHQG
jgi:hypothetical protein